MVPITGEFGARSTAFKTAPADLPECLYSREALDGACGKPRGELSFTRSGALIRVEETRLNADSCDLLCDSAGQRTRFLFFLDAFPDALLRALIPGRSHLSGRVD